MTYNNPCLEAGEDIITVSSQVYPTPATEKILISSNRMTAPALVQISDVMGNRLLQFTTEGDISEVDVSKWQGGMYFVSVIQGNERYGRSFVKM